ncbi:hypothetical protein C8J57DRAFT_1255744 [Mycena rebaudengoi]|nr:hypothetical protein C8J57DRAFT_1255744 [Mycena rebaudengoi]
MAARGAVHARQGLRAQVSPHGARDAGRYCDCLLATHAHMSRDEESKSHSTTSAAEPAMGADRKARSGRTDGRRAWIHEMRLQGGRWRIEYRAAKVYGREPMRAGGWSRIWVWQGTGLRRVCSMVCGESSAYSANGVEKLGDGGQRHGGELNMQELKHWRQSRSYPTVDVGFRRHCFRGGGKPERELLAGRMRRCEIREDPFSGRIAMCRSQSSPVDTAETHVGRARGARGLRAEEERPG